MALSSWNELVTSLNSYLGTSEYQSMYPDWARMVESEVDHGLVMPDGSVKLLRTHWQEAALALTATGGQPYITLADIIEIRTLYLATAQPAPLTPESPQNYARFLTGGSGVPKFYHQKGDRLFLRDTPDSDYAFTGSAYEAIDSLEDNDTNWLMTARPGVYLFGCLKQVAMFQRTEEFPVSMWASQYQAEFMAVEQSDRSSRWSGGPLVVRTDTGNP